MKTIRQLHIEEQVEAEMERTATILRQLDVDHKARLEAINRQTRIAYIVIGAVMVLALIFTFSTVAIKLLSQ